MTWLSEVVLPLAVVSLLIVWVVIVLIVKAAVVVLLVEVGQTFVTIGHFIHDDHDNCSCL